MSLLFDDDNYLKCENCSSFTFKQEKIFGLEKKVNKNKETYYEMIQPKYVIKCRICDNIISVNDNSIVVNEGE